MTTFFCVHVDTHAVPLEPITNILQGEGMNGMVHNLEKIIEIGKGNNFKSLVE